MLNFKEAKKLVLKSRFSLWYRYINLPVVIVKVTILNTVLYPLFYILIQYVTEHAKRAQLAFKIILSFSVKLRLRSILGKTFLAAIQYLQQFTYLRVKC